MLVRAYYQIGCTALALNFYFASLVMRYFFSRVCCFELIHEDEVGPELSHLAQLKKDISTANQPRMLQKR